MTSLLVQGLVLGPLWILSLMLAVGIAYRMGRKRPTEQESVPVLALSEAPPPLAEQAPETEDPRWAELVDQLQFHENCQKRLARSIVDHLRSTTEPLTQDLVAIRTGISTLVSQVREHDHRMNSQEDLTWVESLGKTVRQDMDEAARLTQASHQAFARHVDSLRKGLETILGISQQIEDLSQKINVLSINASIEAARAGAAGRGFKVIAGEVKSLAVDTSLFLGQIAATVASTQALFQGIGGDLDTKKGEISTLLDRQDKSFSSFREAFTGQRAEFETLYRAILSFTDQLDAQVAQISPVVQLHDITVQELENLSTVTSDAFQAFRDLAGTVTGTGHPEDLPSWAQAVRSRLTTADELEVLGSILADHGLEVPQPRARPGALELF